MNLALVGSVAWEMHPTLSCWPTNVAVSAQAAAVGLHYRFHWLYL